jgi:predicted DNA-binding protein
MREKLVNVSAHIPIGLAEKLQQIAQFEERSKSYYIKKGISDIVEEKLQDMQDYLSARQTLKEAKKNNEDFVSFDEVFKGVK